MKSDSTRHLLSLAEARAQFEAARDAEILAFHVFSERQQATAYASNALREAEEREAEEREAEEREAEEREAEEREAEEREAAKITTPAPATR